MMLRTAHLVLALTYLSASVAPVHAGNVLFGTGSNQFTMEFITIGNPGNEPDTDPNARPISDTLGVVGYTYGIGKFEVSRDIIVKYNATPGVVAITLQDMTSFGGNGVDRPATGISWNEAARFVNWLNTSKGFAPAYRFTTTGYNQNIALWTASDTLDFDPLNPYRSKRATYALPSYNEWYKAAYYNPADRTYYNFPNGSDTAPSAVANGTADNTAVYGQNIYQGPADVDQAGGLSPYGVMGLGGNVFEWEESSFDLTNSSGFISRGFRGGSAKDNNSSALLSSSRGGTFPDREDIVIGFRVVSLSSSAPPVVPEPSMMVIGSILGIGGLIAKRRLKKQAD